MVGNDNGKVRSNRTSNRKQDEIISLLIEIRDLLKKSQRKFNGLD